MRAGRTRGALLGRIERLESRTAAVQSLKVRFIGKPPGWPHEHKPSSGAAQELDDSVSTYLDVVFVRARPTDPAPEIVGASSK
jgi:hypothetical protein